MLTEGIRERAERELTPIVEALGYEVVEISYKHANKENHLTIFIHKQGGVTLDDCEAVNNALDVPLEALDITGGAPYCLDISSPGLDRPILSDRDYKRNINTMLDADLIKPLDKKYKLVGTLVAFDEATCTLDVKGKAVVLERADIKLLTQHINFK